MINMTDVNKIIKILLEDDNVIDLQADQKNIDKKDADNKSWNLKLRNAQHEGDKIEIVKEYLKTLGLESRLDDLEPIIPSIVKAVEEVGLSEEDYPMLTFVKLYYGNKNNQPLTRDEYVKLHNLYARDYSDSIPFFSLEDTSVNFDGLDNILFNKTLYSYPEDDVENIADTYFKIFWKPGDVGISDKSRIKIGDKIYLGSEVNHDPKKLKELRKLVFFDAKNKVRSWSTISDLLKKLGVKSSDSKKDRWEALTKILRSHDINVKDNILEIVVAIYMLFSLGDKYKSKIFEKENIKINSDKDLDKFIKSNEKTINNIRNILSRNSSVIDAKTAPYLFDKALNEISASKKEEKPVEDNKQKDKESKEEKKKRSEVTEAKLNKLINWCEKVIQNTKKAPGNVYKYMIMALADAKVNATAKAVSEQKDKEDRDLYNRYVVPNIIPEKDINQNRYDFFKKCNEFNSDRITNGDVNRKLIQYLATTNALR